MRNPITEKIKTPGISFISTLSNSITGFLYNQENRYKGKTNHDKGIVLFKDFISEAKKYKKNGSPSKS